MKKPPYRCLACGMTSPRKEGVIKHIKRKHPELVGKIIPVPVGADPAIYMATYQGPNPMPPWLVPYHKKRTKEQEKTKEGTATPQSTDIAQRFQEKLVDRGLDRILNSAICPQTPNYQSFPFNSPPLYQSIPAAPQKDTPHPVIGFIANVCEKCLLREALELLSDGYRPHTCNPKFLGKHTERLPAGTDIQKIRSAFPEYLKNVIISEWPQNNRYLVSIKKSLTQSAVPTGGNPIPADTVSKIGCLAKVLKKSYRLFSNSEYLSYLQSRPPERTIANDDIMLESELLEFLNLLSGRTFGDLNILQENGQVESYLIAATYLPLNVTI